MAISRKDSPASLLDVPANNCQRALVDESGVIRNQMGCTIDNNGRSVRVALCAHSIEVTM
jgi:hypothetical protein